MPTRSHGLSSNEIYETWRKMRARCQKPNDANYARYGAQGISVCERWESFENFLADMGNRPEGRTLDRYPNKTGNYEPGNCRWATSKQQQNNKLNNTGLSLDGVVMNLMQWVEKTGLPKRTITYRLRVLGWSVKRALTEPAIKEACKRGHPFSELNTRSVIRGTRQYRLCRTCERIRKGGTT